MLVQVSLHFTAGYAVNRHSGIIDANNSQNSVKMTLQDPGEKHVKWNTQYLLESHAAMSCISCLQITQNHLYR